MFILFTDIQNVRSLNVNDTEIVILTSTAEQLKTNICLAVNNLTIDGVVIPKSMIFYKEYLDSFDEGMVDFIVGHEIGHIVNNHTLTALKMFTNETEADAYSVENTNTSPSQAIEYINTMFSISIGTMDKWVFRLITRIERFIRVTSLKKLTTI